MGQSKPAATMDAQTLPKRKDCALSTVGGRRSLLAAVTVVIVIAATIVIAAIARTKRVGKMTGRRQSIKKF